MATGDKGFNLMRVAGFPKTITPSGNDAANGALVYDGNNSTGMYTYTKAHGSGVSCYNKLRVDFAAPITVLGIKVVSILADGQNGIDIFNGGSRYIKVNDVSVWTGGSGNTTWDDETLRTGVTSIEIYAGGSCGGGDWWAEAQGGFYELEIWVDDGSAQGAIL